MRPGLWEQFLRWIQQGEKKIFRLIVLAGVLLVVFQFSQARDPLQFYLAFAQKVESQPMEMTTLGSGQTQTQTQTQTLWTLKLHAQPAAPVKVYQNGILLGSLSKGEILLSVAAGDIQLDAQGINNRVQVQVLQISSGLTEPKLNQTVILQGNKRNMIVRP